MAGDPWSKFFWSDYDADEGLRMSSLAAQGLWMRMLCLMARATPKGELRVGAQPCTAADLSRVTGETEETVAELLGELERRGVFSRNRAGVIFSRRMRKDAEISRKRAKAGAKGAAATNLKTNGNPDLPQQNVGKSSGKSAAPEARSHKQKEEYIPKPRVVTSHAHARVKPPPGIADAETALNYVCQEAEWWPNDNQRHATLGTIREWLALGCSLDLILAGIALARARKPGVKTGNLKRFDSTIRGMRRDQTGGELPVTKREVDQLTEGVAKRWAVQ